jgi:3'(2'), 5'-bisphosphate nucleotidase
MYQKQLNDAIFAAIAARKIIMKIYEKGFDVEIKTDNSPVTQADKEADDLIKSYLKKLYPDYGFLTEESIDDFTRLEKKYVWLVDPVDGTKDFVAHNDEFTTNIALVYNHKVVVGVVMIPATGVIYYAVDGQGSYKRDKNGDHRLHVSDKTKRLTVLCSRFHLKPEEQDMINKHSDKISKVETYGSCLKSCKIAEGLAEVSYRLSSGTKEWDTAASQIIVTEAGGLFVKPDGRPIIYNRKDVVNREGYVIVNLAENILL